jgi:hypothetical protein
MAQAAAPQVAQNDPSMAPPPLGQEPEGEVANVAQNAGLGAAIQGQQQQQAQQAMMQMAQQQQQAQQQPAMMASGGIAGLRADNMSHFREGGVLGFAGKDEEVGSKVPGEFAEGDYEKRPEPPKSNRPATDVLKHLLEAVGTGVSYPLAAAADIAALPVTAIQKLESSDSSITPVSDALRRVTNPSSPEAIKTQAGREMPEGKKIALGSHEAQGTPMSEENKARLASARTQMDTRGIPSVAPSSAPAPTPVVTSPAARPTGAANVPSPPAAPALDLPGLLAQARGATPEQSNVFLDKQAAAQEELNKLRAAQPAPNQVALQALLDAQQKRARLSEQDEAGAGGRGLAALFQGMMGRNEGSSVAAHNEREKQRRRLDIAETLADKEKESAIRDIQAAKAAGDKEKEAAGYKDLGLSKQKSQEIQALREGQSIQAAYHLKSREMENASAEKLQLMKQRHDNATKMMPNWEQAQIKAQVDKLAGPNASIKEILAATETVLSSHNKAGESNEIKRLKLGIDAGKVWDEAHKLDIANALNKPAEQQKIAIARQQAIDNAMNVQSSTSQNPYGGPPPAGKVVRE